jgi:hypothetical protein
VRGAPGSSGAEKPLDASKRSTFSWHKQQKVERVKTSAPAGRPGGEPGPAPEPGSPLQEPARITYRRIGPGAGRLRLPLLTQPRNRRQKRTAEEYLPARRTAHREARLSHSPSPHLVGRVTVSPAAGEAGYRCRPDAGPSALRRRRSGVRADNLTRNRAAVEHDGLCVPGTHNPPHNSRAAIYGEFCARPRPRPPAGAAQAGAPVPVGAPVSSRPARSSRTLSR